MLQKYVRAGKFSIAEVLTFLVDALAKRADAYASFAGHPVHVYSRRYRVFTNKGTRCVSCGLKATHFWLEKSAYQKTNLYHFNLYGLNISNHEVLFTKDHIIPKSLGGDNSIGNLQTMCRPCNGKKGNTVPAIIKTG